MTDESNLNYIRIAGELASILEVSATPKPGNVHRIRDYQDLRYENFLAAGISIGLQLEKLAICGLKLEQGTLSWSDGFLGKGIKQAVMDSQSFQRKKTNVNLGIILLLSPLALSAGICLAHGDKPPFEKNNLRRIVKGVLEQSSIKDAIAVSEAIASVEPGGLGEVPKYDLTKENFREEITEDQITLKKLMIHCQERDDICREYAQNYSITFDIGLPALKQTYYETEDINLATIDTYLILLAKYPDSLIKRKFGVKKALEITEKAKKIIQLGGATTVNGRRELEELDIELREEERLNPGTTADLVASTLFVYLLTGGLI
jgi:triphosphoribosyl-dephospho-CoA synthase